MKQQHGGTLLGFILGVVVGLAVALAVAVYVTKVPVPFVSKGQSRTAEQDAAETEKNKNWDPNAPLAGKNPAKPTVVAPTTTATAPAVAVTPVPAASVKSDNKAELKAELKADGKGDSKSDTKAEVKVDAKAAAKAAAADPVGDLVKSKASLSGEPFTYFVQVGAFRTADDAEAQRAKLLLSGIETKVSEREQSGRAVFRVRVGPFDRKDDADKAKDKLEAAGLETAMVRVPR